MDSNERSIKRMKVSSFRKRFRIALEITGTTTADIAERLELPLPIISQFLVSDKQEPDPAGIQRIATLLNVPSLWLSGYDVPIQLIEVSDGCPFCRNFDFGDARTDVDRYGARIRMACGSYRFPPALRFRFCPDCGKPLSHEAAEQPSQID